MTMLRDLIVLFAIRNAGRPIAVIGHTPAMWLPPKFRRSNRPGRGTSRASRLVIHPELVRPGSPIPFPAAVQQRTGREAP
jgi:hypothetical protein